MGGAVSVRRVMRQNEAAMKDRNGRMEPWNENSITETTRLYRWDHIARGTVVQEQIVQPESQQTTVAMFKEFNVYKVQE